MFSCEFVLVWPTHLAFRNRPDIIRHGEVESGYHMLFINFKNASLEFISESLIVFTARNSEKQHGLLPALHESESKIK